MRGTGPSAGTPAGPDSVGRPPWPTDPPHLPSGRTDLRARRGPDHLTPSEHPGAGGKKDLRVAVSARREIPASGSWTRCSVLGPVRSSAWQCQHADRPTVRQTGRGAGRQRTHAERRECAAQVVEQGRETVLVEGEIVPSCATASASDAARPGPSCVRGLDPRERIHRHPPGACSSRPGDSERFESRWASKCGHPSDLNGREQA